MCKHGLFNTIKSDMLANATLGLFDHCVNLHISLYR